MRQVLIALVTAGALVVPASAATVDPRLFVLHQVDVPARYFFDKDNSLLIPTALVGSLGKEPVYRALRRNGFVNGYFARYLNSDPPRWRYVDSAAFVFRQPQGARGYMPWMVKSGLPQSGGRGRPINLGDEALLYASSSREIGTAVIWRYGRVVAYVHCSEMTEHRALALAHARNQQRRIVSVLR